MLSALCVLCVYGKKSVHYASVSVTLVNHQQVTVLLYKRGELPGSNENLCVQHESFLIQSMNESGKHSVAPVNLKLYFLHVAGKLVMLLRDPRPVLGSWINLSRISLRYPG